MRITVVVPAFNAERTLPLTLESLAQLQDEEYEVIVVDDGSTDGTAELVRGSGFTLVQLEANSGAGVARNVGAQVATGQILAFTDADCIVPRDWLTRIRAAFEDEEVFAVSGPYSGSHSSGMVPRFAWQLLEAKERHERAFVRGCTTSNLAVRRAAFESIGGFPQFALGDDERVFQGHEDGNFGYLASVLLGRLILWDPSVRVEHQFRESVRAFLAEQAFYGQVIYVGHCRFPGMALSYRSNFNKGTVLAELAVLGGLLALGVALVVAGLWQAQAYLVVAGIMAGLVGPVVAAGAMNARMAGLLWRERRSPHYLAFGFLLMLGAYASWVVGGLIGVWKVLRAGFRFRAVEALPRHRVIRPEPRGGR